MLGLTTTAMSVAVHFIKEDSMPRHTTDNPVEIATDVANREADKVWKATGDSRLYFKEWERVYMECLRTFLGPKEILH